MNKLSLTKQQHIFLIRLLQTPYFNRILLGETKQRLKRIISNESYDIEYQHWLNNLANIYKETIIKKRTQ